MNENSRFHHYNSVENVIELARTEGIKRFTVSSLDENLKAKLEKQGYVITPNHYGIEIREKDI